VGENRVRVTNIGYATVGMRDLQEGAYPLSVVVKDKDITTHAIAGFAAYEDERAVRGEILGNYEFIKKYPRIITYYRRTPKEGMNWPNWQGEPEQVQAASYITEGGYREFIEGAERTSVGDDPLEENKFEVLYFSEFWERVQAATDEEAIQLAADLLLGKLRVPTIFSYRSAKGKEEADRIILSFVRKAYFISDAKKVAIVTHLLPSYARDGYHRDLDALSREIIEFADLLVRFSKKQRLNFISNYRTTHPDPPDDIALVLDVIEKLENYPTFVTLEPYKSKFKSVLEQ